MFLRATLHQTKFLLKTKEATLTFVVLLILVLSNFIGNVVEFQGMDVKAMYHPMKLLTLSYNKSLYDANTIILFVQLYPILVVFPAGFSYIKERQTREELYLTSRMGKSFYYISKLVAAFFCTMVVFVVPFLLEIVLNCISFPLQAKGDFTGLDIYNTAYAAMVESYLMSKLYLLSPVWYSVVGILIAGVVSGMLGMFVVAFSYVFRVKYRVMLLLPVYLLLNGITYVDNMMPARASAINWQRYLLLFDDADKNGFYIPGLVLFLLGFSLISVFVRRKGAIY